MMDRQQLAALNGIPVAGGRVTKAAQADRPFSEIGEWETSGNSPVVWSLFRETLDATVIAHLSIPGEPVSKARARFTNYRSPTRVYTPEKTQQAEETVAWHFQRARPDWTVDAELTFGVFGVFFSDSHQRRDVDNMLKLILDACNKLVWKDDSQVTEVSGRKARNPGAPRTEMIIYHTWGYGGPPTKPCEYCGESFRTFRSITNQRFCSRACSNAFRREMNRKECPQCRAEFHPAPNSGQEHCSRTCADAARNRTLACSHCGKEFNRPRSLVRRSNYCSTECSATAGAQRKRTRSYGTCAVCGAPTSRKEYERCNGCRIRAQANG